jgi:hypothetical protein
MTDVNGITGARLVSKVPSKEYQENYDKIFGQKRPPERPAQEWQTPQKEVNDTPTDKT